jgi:hypothetical protein
MGYKSCNADGKPMLEFHPGEAGHGTAVAAAKPRLL